MLENLTLSKVPVLTDLTYTPSRADAYNATVGSMTDVDCPICKNKGYIVRQENGVLFSRKCKCMVDRSNLRRIERSGLSDQLTYCTFDTYETPHEWQKQALFKAKTFTEEAGKWFYIGGTSGSGKTHLCTAIAGWFIERGKETRYLQWRSDIPKLKALVNDREAYEHNFGEFATAQVLYIDDFFKGNITEADINIAYELINARYINRGGITIISSEKSLEDLLNIDEAIGGRIVERSRGYAIKTPTYNWRLKGGK